MITLVTLDGIGGHGGPTSMLGANLVRPLVATGKYEEVEVHGLQSIGPANPTPERDIGAWLEESTNHDARLIADAVRATPNLAAVAGYSGGAAAVSRLLEDMRRGVDYTRDLEIVWAATVANPYAAPDRSGRYGVAGAHAPFPWAVSHYEIANVDDGICRCPKYSTLRFLTDLGQVGTVEDWIRRTWAKQWQTGAPDNWNPIAVADRLATDVGLLRGYLAPGTAHGAQYWERRLFDAPLRQITKTDWEA